MSILQNSIDSIQVGIEDYENPDDRRSVSAVRNISAGMGVQGDALNLLT
jgi:hypothetical protein